MNRSLLIATLLATNMVHAAEPLQPLPQKWTAVHFDMPGGSTCQQGIDPRLLADGQRNLSIACGSPEIAMLQQAVSASPFWGKKVRFSAWVMVQGVDSEAMGGAGGASLFVEYQGSGRPVADSRNDRRMAGSTSWEFREVVLDVARGGPSLTLGVWLQGRGQVWIRDLKFEEITANDSAVALLRPADLLPPPPFAPLPQGWDLQPGGGPHQVSGKCELGFDLESPANGPKFLSVRCANQDIPSFGGAIQAIDPTRYRGERVRLSGWLKVTDVADVANPRYALLEGEAGLWLGVGSPTSGYRKDRMHDRAIKGSTEWVYRDFVVDVPKDSKLLQFGFWMEGKGQVWVKDLQVEKVSKKVPVNFESSVGPASGITLK